MKLNKDTASKIAQRFQEGFAGQIFTYLKTNLTKAEVPSLVTRQELTEDIIIGENNDELIINLTDYVLIFREEYKAEFVFTSTSVKVYHDDAVTGEKFLSWFKV